jgi:hypothetical protein
MLYEGSSYEVVMITIQNNSNYDEYQSQGFWNGQKKP